MAERKMTYKMLDRIMSIAVIADAVLFFTYLICAGIGLMWAKVLLTILCVVISVGCLAVLYIKNELLRARSLWITLAAGAVLICLLFSLILNFPSPKPTAIPYQASAEVVMQIERI